MENNINVELNEETTPQKKSSLPLIGIIVAAVLVILLVFLSVYNSPKNLAGRLIKNTDDAVEAFFEVDDSERPLFLTESHQSETMLSMSGEDFGMEGDIELEFKTGYQNDTGDLLAELELGLADLDAITAGLYLQESELALISSLLAEKYVLDLESETELGKNTTLEERLSLSGSLEDQEKIDELQKRIEDKAAEYRKYALKVLPKDSISKSKGELEIFGEDKKVSCVEIVLDEDGYQEWAEAVLEKAADDDELQELAEDIADFIVDTYQVEDIDPDEIDIEESCEEAIDELDDSEVELELKIYYQGSTPQAYEFAYDDGYDKGEGIVQMLTNKDDREVLVKVESEYDEVYFHLMSIGENEAQIELEFEGMKYDVLVEETDRGVYEISGKIESDYGLNGEISGEIVEDKDETTFEVEYDLSDDYSSYEVVAEGKVVTDGAVETSEMEVKAVVDGEDMFTLTLDMETEEVKKNKEYATEGELQFSMPSAAMEYTVDIESSTIYGSEVDVDVPSWSKSDVYAKVSDQEELQELLDALMTDFETGISDIVSVFLYGGQY